MQILTAALWVLDKTQRVEASKILYTLSTDIVVDREAIRSDAAKALDEYEAAQAAKKKGDDLKSHYVRTARDLARSEVDVDQAAVKQREALKKLCDQVAQTTGIDAQRFAPTPPQGPRDCGITYADLLGQVAPKLFQAAAAFMKDLQSQSLDREEQERRMNEWFANRSSDLREVDGSEIRRLSVWFWGTESWPTFEEKVLRRAQPLMQPDQLKRMSELSPPKIEPSIRRLLHDWVRTIVVNTTYDFEADSLAKLEWYESILANLPASIQQLGPLAHDSAIPHPPHQSIVEYTYRNICDYLRISTIRPTTKAMVLNRLWPLWWWTASYGGKVKAIDASAIGHAVSNDLATLYELVWFLVQPGYRDIAENLVDAVKKPERLCLGINAPRDAEIQAVIDAVAQVCRQQEHATDEALPATLVNTWQKLPAPPRKHAGRCLSSLCANDLPSHW